MTDNALIVTEDLMAEYLRLRALPLDEHLSLSDAKRRIELNRRILRSSSADLARTVWAVFRYAIFWADGYTDFGAWCADQLNVGQDYSQKLLDAGRLLEDFVGRGLPIPADTNEFQVRSLYKLIKNPDDAALVWEEFIKSPQRTARVIKVLSEGFLELQREVETTHAVTVSGVSVPDSDAARRAALSEFTEERLKEIAQETSHRAATAKAGYAILYSHGTLLEVSGGDVLLVQLFVDAPELTPDERTRLNAAVGSVINFSFWRRGDTAGKKDKVKHG